MGIPMRADRLAPVGRTLTRGKPGTPYDCSCCGLQARRLQHHVAHHPSFESSSALVKEIYEKLQESWNASILVRKARKFFFIF